MRKSNRLVAPLSAALLLAACSGGNPSAPAASCQSGTSCIPSDEKPTQPGALVKLALTASDQAALSDLQTQLTPLQSATAQSLLDAHPVPFDNDLGYDPKSAKDLDRMTTSLALSPDELDKLGEQGFLISTREVFPNMAYGLTTIYAYDLPVYISIDPIVEAVHTAYDSILKQVETNLLSADLATLLQGSLARNAEHTSDAQARKDLDFYFSVALSLLQGAAVKPAADSDASLIATFVKKAAAGSGIEDVTLFGVPRSVDFSQFKPRGHYTDSPELTRYFQAMMWLGRIDFRLIETQTDGTQVFYRRQLNATLALRDAVASVMAAFERIDAVVSAFIGDHDYMQLSQVGELLKDLGASSIADVDALSDQAIAQTIIDRGYGAQQIMSQVIFKDPSSANATLPLDRSFAFFGQRYVVDSHVFSEVTYDRVLPKKGFQARYLPDPLDAAYAALGNSAALPLLRDDLEQHGYAPQLERMRTLIDGHDDEFWQKSLYNLWLSSLRALSAAPLDGLPSVARSEPWSRRVLNAQLGSWAELRHDTILYAKQSYTSGDACQFPDAYVDPYPEAFARLARFGKKGKALTALLSGSTSLWLVKNIGDYFSELESVANILRDMAEQELKAVPFNAAQMAFINDAVKTQEGVCGGPTTYSGWYSRLLYGKSDAEMDPTIADVHTDPGGNRPAHVLHVATGLPRLMILTVNNCDGPHAYAGVSFAYHEVVTDGVVRINDSEWAGMTYNAADVPWMKPVLNVRNAP